METVKFREAAGAEAWLERVKAIGAVLLRDYVDKKTCLDILEEIDIPNMCPIDEHKGKVRQQFQTANYHYPDETPPSIVRLGSSLEEFLRSGLPHWRPNDAAVQRYLPSQSVGIGPHRDYARDKLLVAVATLTGEADFHIELNDETGRKNWSKRKLQPGDLVLMRAPGLTGAEEDRPYHQIDPPRTGERVSLALRHNVRLETDNITGGDNGNG